MQQQSQIIDQIKTQIKNRYLGIPCEIALRRIPQDLVDDIVDISSGDGLVQSGNKPLPEPMPNKFYDVISHHQATMC